MGSFVSFYGSGHPVSNVSSNVHRLSFIMDRPKATHPWQTAFQSMDNSPDPTRRAVCGNWRMDYRISAAREQKMLNNPSFRGNPDEEEWWKQIHEYFSHAICQPAVPGASGVRSAYTETVNSNNLVAPRIIPGHDQLIHISSLNNMLWRLSSAEYATADLKLNFRDITGLMLPQKPIGSTIWEQQAFSQEVDRIAESMQQQGLEKVRELSGLLCDTLGETQPPWWACFAEEVKLLLDQRNWTALCRALGLGHLEKGHWILIWRYEINSTGSLYRPTVVESNKNPFHFPSLPTSSYGITMPLDEIYSACREVLHPPLFGDVAVNACTGELGKIADSPVVDYNNIIHLRKKHREHLGLECTDNNDDLWLQRHEALI